MASPTAKRERLVQASAAAYPDEDSQCVVEVEHGKTKKFDDEYFALEATITTAMLMTPD